MRIELLGPLRVVTPEGDETTPRSAQQRRVLAALAAHHPRPVSVGALEDLLWPRGAPSANALQAVISKLRRAVAPATIDSDGRGYVLAGVTTDVAEFEAHLAAGRYAEAEALARGPVLAEIVDDELGAAASARITGLIGRARSRRLDAIVDERPGDALAELESLVIAEPLDEAWWAKLMVAQYRCGRQADALRTFQRARVALADQLGIEPGPELRDLERRILEQDPTLRARTTGDQVASPDRRSDQRRGADRSPSPGLPARLASFVGRERELADLEEALRDHRLITLLGPGGAGKTSTALELARRAAPDTARLVELSSLSDADAIVRAVARAVGLPDNDAAGMTIGNTYDDPLDRVVDALSIRDLLLVVDNCEHVVSEAAAIIERVLVECPAVSVVATSRESLGIPGEYGFPLPPLPSADAVELFLQRAVDHGAAGGLHEGQLDLIATLCARLDGLPLAIELAVARLRSMTVDELLERLDDRFALLASGAKTAEPRQQTLRGVVEWSHELLDDAERIVFRRLSAFVGGTSRAAAEVVCAGRSPEGVDVSSAEVGALLDRLVDKSLVVAEPGERGMRFSLLETLAAYAWERLLSSSEHERVLVRHAQYVADFVQPALRGLTGPDQGSWIATLREERQNIEAAVETAVARDDAQLAIEIVSPIGWYFYMSGDLVGGTALLSAALGCSGPTEVEPRATALAMYGWLMANGPSIERAVTVTGEAYSLLDQVADPFAKGLIANTHVMAQIFAGRLDLVERSLPEVMAMAEHAGDPWIVAITRLVEAESLQFRGETTAAELAIVEAAVVFEAVGDRFAEALAIAEASEIAEQYGHYDRAVEMLEHGIAIADEVGFSGHPLAMRARLGNVEILRGNLDIAESYHRALLADGAASAIPWLQTIARFGLSIAARRRGDLDTARAELELAAEHPRAQAVPHLRGLLLVARGYLADQSGDAALALQYQRGGLEAALQLQTPRGIANAFEGCAGALALTADAELRRLAARLLGRADRLRRDAGGPMPAAERFDVDRAEHRLRQSLGEVFDIEFAGGADTSTEALVTAVREIPADRPVDSA